MSTEKLKEKLGELEEALAFADWTTVLPDGETIRQVYGDGAVVTFYRAAGDQALIWYSEEMSTELAEKYDECVDDDDAVCTLFTEENATDRQPIRMLGAYLLGELEEE